MKRLISVVLEQIKKQVKGNEINIIRLENFDNPLIYQAICEDLDKTEGDFEFVPKLTLENYLQFKDENDTSWSRALEALHRGRNHTYDEMRSAGYDANSYIDFEQAITKWRNESPNLQAGKTSLVLLMGTEAAPDDAGSLQDTTLVISPREIIATLNLDYGEWFVELLEKNSITGKDKETQKAIHTLYKTIFASININVFKFSDFIDGISAVSFETAQELIDCICETLNRTWQIPSVFESKSIPKVGKLKNGKVSDARIVSSAIKFIERADDIPSAATLKKLKEKFVKYAEVNDVEESEPFPSDTKQFVDFLEFEGCVLDFMCGIDLEENRAKLLDVDYAIINQIIGTKLPRKTSSKPQIITGDPMEAYSRMFLEVAKNFKDDYKSQPINYCVRVGRIALSDCVKGAEDEAHRLVCNFLGGILSLFNETSILYEDQLIEFSYEDDVDPFDFANWPLMESLVRATGKWGDPSKVQFKIIASNMADEHSYEFNWAFSPYSAWSSAFSYLSNTLSSGESYTLPEMAVCENIQDYLSCESEDEFCAQIGLINDIVISDEYHKMTEQYFGETIVWPCYKGLRVAFGEFSLQLVDHGFYSSLGLLRKVVKEYTSLMDSIYKSYLTFNDIQKEKIILLLNCFTIVSERDVLEKDDVGEVILPPYHPVMLEKIDAQQLFLRDGFAELLVMGFEKGITKNKLLSKQKNLVQLSSITQGVDFVVGKAGAYLPCKNIWGYYGVYFDERTLAQDFLAGNAFSGAMVTDDEDATAMLHVTPISNVVVRNVMDYIKTFPSTVDGLNVAFIAPTDMQHIVAAIHSIVKQLEKDERLATINLKIVSLNSKKNSATYLKKWLDKYFDDESYVKVNTSLRNINTTQQQDLDDILHAALRNCDLCFNYDILQSTSIQFDKINGTAIDKDQAKFPMTFNPDTISATHGRSRKVSVSQFQFLASKSHTQANYIVNNSNSVLGIYRTFKTLELKDLQNHIIEICHEVCKWVVCIDSAIDRRMLEHKGGRIIGFTTGEGSYGELNVTVSARKDILMDIKEMLRKRIKEKFLNWTDTRLQAAVNYCVDDLSRFMDGSRILKALNPYDYELHSFLGYVLTLQLLGLSVENDDYVVRSLVSLDSYKYWFNEDDTQNEDNKRPDFMLIEIPKTANNLNPDEKLKINVKIIECKMGFENEAHTTKAKTQLEKGLRAMATNWNSENSDVMHRYWLNQLYRAIIFSPLYMDNSTKEYAIIREKMYGILSGNYEIEWSGDIFAFWLDSEADEPIEHELDSVVPDELAEMEIKSSSLFLHEYGQKYIQKMLLPVQDRMDAFEQNTIANPMEDTAEDDIFEEDDNVDEKIEEASVSVPASTPLGAAETGKSIPKATDVQVPYLLYLADGKEHTRKDSLAWFEAYFDIKSEDKEIEYDSNGHRKWETVLDRIISLFRKDLLLENTVVAQFHLTKLGNSFAESMQNLPLDTSFEKALEAYKKAFNENSIVVENQTGEIVVEISPAATESEVIHSEEKSEQIVAAAIKQKPSLESVRFLIGDHTRTKERIYWEFGNKNLNNRHLLINGNSGCGKTYCIQTLLLEMVRSGISGVVFDYTSGFTPDKLDPLLVKELGNRIQQRVVYIDKIPVNPFSKQIIKVGGIEVPEADTVVATRLANVFSTVYGFGGQQKSALYKAIKNGLEVYKEKMSFSYLEEELNNVAAKQAETVLSKIQPFLDLAPFAEEEGFNWGDIRDSDGMVYVMQLDGFDRPTQLLQTELLLWDIWNYCVKCGNEEHPFVVVLDEAQNLSHNAESPSAKFLTEGRKFGISAWYATQFMKPQLSDDEIQRLQQAGQKLYFCPPDDGIITVAKNIDINMQGAREWAPKLKALKKGECVTCGNMLKNEKLVKYEPRIIKVTSLQERLNNDE